MKTKYLLLFLFIYFSALSQDNYNVSKIEQDFIDNAYTVINENIVDLQIFSIDKYTIKTRKVVTVFSEKGLSSLDFSEIYGRSNKIKQIQVTQLDAQGKIVKVFKQKDFKDYSLSQGMAITDIRVLTFEFRPVQYPVIFIYESEIESRNTAFLPKWQPIQYFSESILLSTFSIENSSGIVSTPLLYNPDFTKITKVDQGNKVTYTLKDFKAVTSESNMPSSNKLLPSVVVTLGQVSLEGIKGEFTNWEQLGNWYYHNFIKGTEALTPETIKKVNELTANFTDDMAKAKVLYEYMQSHTRYISVQLGVGGWKPMLANDVKRLNYGDCKGLSNYYRALLKVVGIESYPVVVYGSSSSIDIREESVCLQGNHMIIAIPLKQGGYQWVECTNNQLPFGYIAGFTDDRQVLVVKENDSEIVKTKAYTRDESTQISKGIYSLKVNGDIEVALDITSKGGQFDNRVEMYYANSRDREKYYKQRFSSFNINEFKEINLSIDNNTTSFDEKFSFTGAKYATKLGNRLVFSINGWNVSNSNLSNSKNRKQPLYISSSWKDEDVVELEIPEGYVVDNLPENVNLNTKYGDYKVTYQVRDQKIYYTRLSSANEGLFTVEDYDLYRKYKEEIQKNDQAKIVLKLNQ
ncbi:DUF3858 domain-containing protein [Myroides odoratimimus]|uniref:DUF3857 domain-containing protein n=1 Tax=Myroides odoratimimus CCUG 10230 TaxID=883150 RepID=A0ABP2NG21_9FLAO|nr:MULTISPECIES: DUF3857 domain-containing protein [Myroides]AJA69009.1 hypothetical protein MYRA21_1867 [Myroides sp. A21]EHO12273.1 hypothetical protein HMPREF9712_00520 [Myroides odoratimimus CCUG 10230]EHO13760.1 hypothetical protein HMPREF9714_00759 [Myroides odoratimimus CCUG 12901]MCA4793591.1 DUF3858 domain-containing protein [Myroides odoratimimus]MCA4807455.1 DUF3858 domain-containing protein [Myroides odoratimimus]